MDNEPCAAENSSILHDQVLSESTHDPYILDLVALAKENKEVCIFDARLVKLIFECGRINTDAVNESIPQTQSVNR